MKRHYIILSAALATTMGLTSCGTMYLEGGGSAPIYSSSTVYDAGYGVGYDANYGYPGIAYEDARQQAYFLSDKMAYELGLSDAQFEAIYEINLDYLLNMRGESSIYGDYWARRNSDIFYVLNASQYNYFVNIDYFYRPIYWYDNSFAFSVYDRYNNPRYYYRSRPVYYDTYRGGRNRHRNSYYAGRFGERRGQPVVTNRGRSWGNGSRRNVVKTPVNGNNNGRRTYGNQKRSSFDNSRSFGNANANTNRKPVTVRPGQRIQPSNNDSRFGGSRGGTVNRPTTTTTTTNRPKNNNNNSTFGAGTTRPSTNRTGSNSSFGNGTTRTTTPQPRPSTPKNNGSFGGHR